MNNKEPKYYILKIGKMYLQALYVSDKFPLTHYIDSLEFSNDNHFIYDSARFKTHLEADYTKDILRDLLGYEIETIEIIPVTTDNSNEGDSDEQTTNNIR